RRDEEHGLFLPRRFGGRCQREHQQRGGVHGPPGGYQEFARNYALGSDGTPEGMAALQQRQHELLEAAMTRQEIVAGQVRRPGAGNRGFTLIEVMVSIVVLTIGLLSLLGVFGMAMASTQTSEQNAIAKQLANEAIEGILTARETTNVTWDQIQNTGPGGGNFLTGFNPIYKPRADGNPERADDSGAGGQTLQLAGPDGIFGTSDDISQPLTSYTRQIVISPVTDSTGVTVSSLRLVTITVQYTTPQFRFP